MAIPIPHYLLQCFCISLILSCSTSVNAKFMRHMHFDWGAEHSMFLSTGDDATLTLDQTSGSGIQSEKSYLFGSFEMLIKLVHGNSAGTVTSYFLSSVGEKHNEIDFEFLGNVSGQPYVIHTNVFTDGAGGREQQFYPWFDPTTDFHNYTIQWSPSKIVWYVDSIPIRVYRNYKEEGIPYPNTKAMRVYSSIWNADSWATRGGLDKIDWKRAPFVARLRRFRPRACQCDSPDSIRRCATPAPRTTQSSSEPELSNLEQLKMTSVRNKSMVYNYCHDMKRYKGLVPGDCLKPQ